MERFVGYSDKRVREDLPPRDVWLHNPNHKLLETPVDERGLVDFPQLVSLIKGTVEPGYQWPSPYNDRHHLQWPRRFYPEVHEADITNPFEFRNLGIGVVRVPRYFHNWVHLITEPPKVPSDEVMRYRVDAQRVALSLFNRVRDIRVEGRELHLGKSALNDYLLEQLEPRFDKIVKKIEIAKRQPREFYAVNYDEVPVNGPADIVVLADRIARESVYRSAVRDIRVPIVA